MNNKEIISIASKTFGLYFIIKAVIGLKEGLVYGLTLNFLGSDDNADAWFYVAQNIFDTLFYLVGAWYMIAKADLIASKLTKRESETLNISLTKFDTIELIVIAVGLITIVSGLPEILGKVTQFIYFNNYEPEDNYLFWNEKNKKAEIFFAVFKVAIGLLTILNGRLIAIRLTKIGDKDEELS
jgi:hypothetical protein